MSPRNNNNAKTKIKVTEKTTLQITQEETFEISDGTSSQLPPARQRRKQGGKQPQQRALPKPKGGQKRNQPQQRKRKQLPPPKPEPVKKLVGSISLETLKELTAQHAKPESKIIPDAFFQLLRKKQKHNANRKALTGSKKVKALPAPKPKRRQ